MTDNATLPRGARALDAATPADRDRYADLLRLFSIGMVAVGHWVVALLTVNGAGTLGTAMPAMLSTWVWQVMALFFFVGGFAHARALRHDVPCRVSVGRRTGRPRRAAGSAGGDFVRSRVARLLPPVLAMLVIWTGLALAMQAAGLTGGVFAVGRRIITVPLWFIGVYLLVVLAAPAMMRLHRRHGLWPVFGALAAAAGVVDLAATSVPLVGYANMLFVWLAVHQLGYAYADGTLLRGGRRLASAFAVGGLAGAALLVFGTDRYPVLMVGLPGNEASNSAPPTLALLGQGVFLVGVALLLRPAGTALAARPRAWLVVAAGNSMIMTIFCWHLTACYLVQGFLLLTGVTVPAASALPLWLLACTLVCALLVVALRRFERPRPAGTGHPAAAVAGTVAAALGLFAISRLGLDSAAWPQLTSLALLAAGVLTLRR
ncbi:hypothetical protein BKA01_002289 [Pseudonocardia eucalypti]|nr:hypothetical protein [Pseudonocardia eucalypti]